MGKDLYTVYSHNEDRLSQLVSDIEYCLSDDKIHFKGPQSLPAAPARAIRRVEDSKNPNDVELFWLLNVNAYRLGFIVSHLDGSRVFGYEIQIPSRHTRAEDHISEKIRDAKNIYYEKIEAAEANHVPFSYDPNQDFKTEPDR